MIRVVLIFSLFLNSLYATTSYELKPLAPKIKEEHSKQFHVSGELIFRYENQDTTSPALKRIPKGSEANIMLSYE